MKLSILQQDLLPAITAVSRSVGVKVNLPVLGNILLLSDGAKLKLSATNLEVGIIKSVNAEITDPGDITIPAKTLVELIQSLGPSEVDIETSGDRLSVSAGKFKATVNGISASEFPVIPLSSSKGAVFPKDSLASISSIIFAAAVDEGRPTLTGILTSVSNKKLDFVATDGFRLAHKTIEIPDLDEEVKLKVLVPKRTFEEVLRVISEENPDNLEISTSDSQNQIIFKVGNSIISSRLIEGPFPAWEKLIPKTNTTRLIIDRGDLLAAVKLASVFAKESNIITFKLDNGSPRSAGGAGKVLLDSSSKELGNQNSEIEGQIEGENLTIAYNAKFLQDVVSATNATQLIMEFNGPLSATLIKPMGVEGLEYILMPVRQS